MTKDDYLNCEFIEKRLRFITYEDFCRNCKLIKFIYNTLDNNMKKFYKWYVYSNIFIDEVGKKDLIWNFLNYDDEMIYNVLISKRKIEQ